MFQNISNNDVFNDNNEFQENRINLLLKELFKPNNCIIYIITFLISIVKIRDGIMPFGLAIVAACLGSTIPIFMVYIISGLAILIFHGGMVFSGFFYTSLIFFIILMIFKPKASTDDRNEVFNVGTKLFFASFIYYILKNIKGTLLVSDVFFGFIISLITYVFYKIFVNGIIIIRDFSEKKAFTKEEIIAAIMIIVVSMLSFKDIIIFGNSISYILAVILIIYVGFNNGIFIGGLSGFTIGISLILINNLEMTQVLVLTISGILGGIFGFIIMHNKFTRNKNDSNEMLLGNSGENRLSYYEEIKEKINAIAQTITEITDLNTKVADESNDDILKKDTYVNNFLDLMENYMDNIFYYDLLNNENIIENFFDTLVKDDIITEKRMLEIFRKYNYYILLRDQKLKDDLQDIIKIANRAYKELQMTEIAERVKKEESKKYENELKNISKIMSTLSNNKEKIDSYEKKEKEIYTLLKGKMYPIRSVKINKCENGKYIVELNFEYKNSIKDKNRISNIELLISKSLENKIIFQKDKKKLTTGDYIQIYATEDKYGIQIGSSKIAKDVVSGDSNLQIKLSDGKYLLAISDGMGSGEKARRASKFIINSLNTMLSNGFKKDETIELINSELNFNREHEIYATVDISILDLYKGSIILSKNGACNTYIKNKKNVNIYKGNNLPIGIVEKTGLENQEIKLNDGDIILMCSDGLVESTNETKKDWIEEFLKNVNTNNVQKISDLILGEAIDNSFGVPKDDITVIVAKIVKKK